MITDPHKWLNVPVGVAATFVRDRSILFRAFTQEPADYLEGAFSDDDVQVSLDAMGIPYFDFGVELSAPVRGVAVWGVLKELGVEGVRARVVGDNDFARHVAQRANDHDRLETLLDPVLSICVFRYVPEHAASEAEIDAANREILQAARTRDPICRELDGREGTRLRCVPASSTPAPRWPTSTSSSTPSCGSARRSDAVVTPLGENRCGCAA